VKRLVCFADFIKVDQTCCFGGSKSRNKVSVGEPAEGSLMYIHLYIQWFFFNGSSFNDDGSREKVLLYTKSLVLACD